MDYVHRRRVKIWGTLEAVEGDEVTLSTMDPMKPAVPVMKTVGGCRLSVDG
jgi:hypothetical protein